MGQPERQPEPAWIPGSPDADRHWLAAAIDLSRLCPPSDTAFSVGAILVGADGRVLGTGYSREEDQKDHAEEVALTRAARSPRSVAGLPGATLYSSLEPCIARASRPVACAELARAAGIRRVVIAWQEPPVFVPGGGAAWLRDRGVEVAEFPELAESAKAASRHLL